MTQTTINTYFISGIISLTANTKIIRNHNKNTDFRKQKELQFYSSWLIDLLLPRKNARFEFKYTKSYWRATITFSNSKERKARHGAFCLFILRFSCLIRLWQLLQSLRVWTLSMVSKSITSHLFENTNLTT